MKSYQVITPDTKELHDVDFYIGLDHVPSIESDESMVEYSKKLPEEKRKMFVGKNTILDLRPLPDVNRLKIIDTGNQKSSKLFTISLNFMFIAECHEYNESLTNISDFGDYFQKKSKQFNVVMNKIRPDRLLTSCWINNNKQHYDFLYTQSWNQESVVHKLYELLQIGEITDFENSANIILETMPRQWIGTEYDFINATNFQKNMSDIFYQSVFSVVLEPTFWENDVHISEKYLNALYGLTIPIVSGYNSCDCLKSMGFDVFDDIIDTSYQHIENAATRAWQMMELNKTVFFDAKTIIKDKGIQQRIIKNLEWARQPQKLFETAFLNLNSTEEKKFFIDNYYDIKKILLVEQPKSMSITDLDKMYSLLKSEFK